MADIREVLEELAFTIHEQNIGQEGAADIPEHRLVKAFERLLGDKGKADMVVNYIEKRAGLLIGQGEKDGQPQFSFPHRTFQEFLAACRLESRNDFASTCAKLARTAPAHWQLVLPLAARLAKAERGAMAADVLIGGSAIGTLAQPPLAEDWHCALLAGAQLLEIGQGAINKDNYTRKIADRVAGWLAAALPVHPEQGGLPAKLRAQAGDVLAALGDPRFDGAFHQLPKTAPKHPQVQAADAVYEAGLGFIHIPADPAFVIGTRAADQHKVRKATGGKPNGYEINDQACPTPAFFIARYPVTVAQFRYFVEATGFRFGNENVLRDPDTRPVRYVNWHEALAYCDWLNEVLKDAQGFAMAQALRSGKLRVTLPSELEWEKAARGGLADAVFPWGNGADPERANYAETELRDTSAVGCFPVNGYGLADTVGNVWEWTRSLWGADSQQPEFGYPYQAGDLRRENLQAGNSTSRVVRGGSWFNVEDFARCADRRRTLPDIRSVNLGFRVVLSSPPV
jgi:formylglycine-generating enzyme required for sulfatase activity